MLDPAPTPSSPPTRPLGETYDPGAFYDEMFEAIGKPRRHYRALAV